MPRPASPDDLYRLRVALDPRLSLDGRTIAFTIQTVAETATAAFAIPPRFGAARQVTIGAKHDCHLISADGERRLPLGSTGASRPAGGREADRA
jgi:hypothetical protein